MSQSGGSPENFEAVPSVAQVCLTLCSLPETLRKNYTPT